MKGCELEKAKTLERGFENDRRYMLIDNENVFISQRTHPTLAMIIPTIIGEDMNVTYGESQFQFSLSTVSEKRVKVSLFEHTLDATIVNEKANEWFSEVLNMPVRLVKMTDADIRVKALKKAQKQTEVSFADGYPYLIAGTRSLVELNERLEQPVLMDRFRPNIIVETEVAHEEDSWEEVHIGTSKMHVIKPCARCPVITVDQESGIKAKEPLKTLATYRKENNMIYFGSNAICRQEGEISIGDEVISL